MWGWSILDLNSGNSCTLCEYSKKKKKTTKAHTLKSETPVGKLHIISIFNF